jgi:hypothetical protein
VVRIENAESFRTALSRLLSSTEVRALLGASGERVNELVRARRVIALRDSADNWWFPAWQFDDGSPIEPLVAAFWEVAGGAASDWTAASWCVAPDDALAGCSPADWARAGRDPQHLARVARQQGARLAQ